MSRIEATLRELLRFEGPLGSFYLREDSDRPVVMVASGTGFAPIKAVCAEMPMASVKPSRKRVSTNGI
jgi:NAD(P)H-flavin reductase